MPSFKPRDRKQRGRQKTHQDHNGQQDTNAAEILPETQNERDLKRQALRAALRGQHSNISTKKQKRLDKYIETKLKKEENLSLLKKLASTKIDTSLLRSTKDLGLVKETKRSTLKRALGREHAGIGSQTDRELLYERQGSIFAKASSESDEAAADIDTYKSSRDLERGKKELNRANISSALGGGLKRPLELGEDGNPLLKKRQRVNQRRTETPAEEALPWDGFTSESDTITSLEESGSDCSSDSESDIYQDSSVGSLDEQKPLGYPLFSNNLESKAQHLSPRIVPRARDRSDFKDWAIQQINEAKDFAPVRTVNEAQVTPTEKVPLKFRLRPPEHDPLPAELNISGSSVQRLIFSVQVDRPENIQDGRMKLPVVSEEQKIMEAIHNHPVVIICGATGSGKTTQIPQFLYEAGYGSSGGPSPGMIAVTQPRRVAAVTMAKRVAEELGSASGRVAYQIRYDSTVDKSTAIKFMTDGILIREIAQDFALTKYSAVVIDEAHERSVNTDILIGMVSRIVDLRMEMNRANADIKPLKMIIMSATLMVEAFINNPVLFRGAPPPLVQSEGRQYPVTLHFARRTQRDYVDELYRKIARGHKKLPPGAMLVFLTGENEIFALSKRLKQSLSTDRATSSGRRVHIAAKDAPLETEDMEIGQLREDDNASGDEDDAESGDEDGEFELGEPAGTSTDVLILPLYSKLPTKEQLRVFESPPESTRLIVLATNVAETSITIPGIRYVFDCGRAKEKRYNQTTGVQSFEIGWISKASAAQRAGRAGRTSPGHCYRLYSSAVYERDFAEHTEPEVLRMPVESVVLQLKSMDLQHVVNFPFPTPPDRQSIAKAEKLLSYLGAVDGSGKVTPVGRDLSMYPLSPRLAKMLAIGHQHGCIYLTIAMVAALAVPELFIPENQLKLENAPASEDAVYTNADRLEDDERERRKREYNKAHHSFSTLDRQSDACKLLSAFCAYAWATKSEEPTAFCSRTFIRPKAAREALQLFQQLLRIVSDNRPGLVDPRTTTLPRASDKQVKALKQIVAAAFIDQVAIRADLAPNPPETLRRNPKRAIDVPYLALFPTHEGKAAALPADRAIYIHPSSILARSPPAELPAYLVYSHLQRSSAATVGGDGAQLPRVRMHALAPVGAAQLSALARGTPLLEYGKPIGRIEAVPGEHDRRVCWVVPSLVGQKGGLAWPLPALKVVQKKAAKGGWEVERVAG